VSETRILGTRPSQLPADPAYFLHSLDIEGDQAVFIPTSRALLSEAAFIDGRSPIATGTPLAARLSELLSAPREEPTGPDRYIFHMSFCGSTLLSRLLDVPGRSLVMKEPNCLADLANWKTLSLRAGRPVGRLGPALQLARSALRRRWADGEAVTVKPSSWVNNLLDELVEDREGILPLFVTIDRAAFVRAVFRGGTERLAFTAQLAQHLATDFPDGDRLMQQAVEATDDPLGRVANLAVVAHHIQLSMFDKALGRGGWGRAHLIDLHDILDSPFGAAEKASRALRLDLKPRELERTVKTHAGRYSKAPAMGYSADRQRSDDDTVLANHGRTIEAAVSWGNRIFEAP